LDIHIELSQANFEAIKAVIAEAKSAFGRSSVPQYQWPKFPEIKTKVPDEVSVVMKLGRLSVQNKGKII